MGLGNIAHKFASDLRLVPEAQLVAVGSRDMDKARAFASEYGAANMHDSYEALAADPMVDAIYVATPHSHHYDNVILCINNGKAVLCEKAFAVNKKQAEEMIALARKKKVFLMEALWTRFLPHYQKLISEVNNGKVGELKSVLINFGFRPKAPVPARLFDPALAGGTVLDIGIYNIFIAMGVLGYPDEIDAWMTPSSTGIDEQCAVTFRYKNGAIAQLFSSFSSNLPTEAEISGTKGRIRMTHRFYTPEADLEFYPERPDSRQLISFEKDLRGHGYQLEAKHVCECLVQGLTESPIVSFDDTIGRMAVLDEVRRKAGIVYPQD